MEGGGVGDEQRRGSSCGKNGKGISVVSKGVRGSSVGVNRSKAQPIVNKDMLVIHTHPTIKSPEKTLPLTPLHPSPHPTPTGRTHFLRSNHLHRNPALYQPATLSEPPLPPPPTLTSSLQLPPNPPSPPPLACDRIYQTIKKQRINFSHDTNDKTLSNCSSRLWQDSAQLRKGVIFGSTSVVIRVSEVSRLDGGSPRRRLEDAVSIMSRETGTLDHSQICIDESVLLSREIDVFQQVGARKLLPDFTMWLARERQVGWLVTLKVFSKQQEVHAHRELSLRGKLPPWDDSCLQIYQTLVEGGVQSEIHFVMEPYEAVLSDWLQRQRPTLREQPGRARASLERCVKEIERILERLGGYGVEAREKLVTSDFVWAAGRLKLHSVGKFESVGEKRSYGDLGGVGELLDELGRWLAVAP